MNVNTAPVRTKPFNPCCFQIFVQKDANRLVIKTKNALVRLDAMFLHPLFTADKISPVFARNFSVVFDCFTPLRGIIKLHSNLKKHYTSHHSGIQGRAA